MALPLNGFGVMNTGDAQLGRVAISVPPGANLPRFSYIRPAVWNWDSLGSGRVRSAPRRAGSQGDACKRSEIEGEESMLGLALAGVAAEGIDRMYLNVYVPQMQREQGVASFFRFHRGHSLPPAR
jgi:hypothetical protein